MTADFDQMSDDEFIAANPLTESELDELEHRLQLNAAVRGWTGDPLQQPLEEVAKIARAIVREREPVP